MQANANVMTWLMMTFPLLKHQHEINVSWTAGCPHWVAYEAIKQLNVSVLPA